MLLTAILAVLASFGALVITLPETSADPGLDVKVGNFARQTATGNQPVTGVGFTPKVVIFWGTLKTTEGFSADLSHFEGFMVSATEQRALANFGTGLGAAARLARKAIVIISDDTPTISAEAGFVSFDADGFTVDWTTNDGTQNIIHYMALGGADLANVKVGHFVASLSIGNQAVTGVGFQPKMVFMMGHSRAETIPSNLTRGNFFGGYAVSRTERATLSWAHRALSTGRATNQRTDRVIVVPDRTTLNEAEADFVSMDPDGFTINWLTADLALIIPYLAMGGVALNAKVGSFNSATTTGNQAVTGTGFQPDIVRLMTWSEPASTAILTGAKAAYGAATGPAAQGVAGVLRDGATSVNADDYTLTTKAIRLADPGSPPATLAEADFVSLDADGFTLDWTVANATAREILYWAVGGQAAAGCEAVSVTTSDPTGQLWFNETVEPDGIPFTTQVNVSASFQTGATPALSVTNDGTGTCDVTIRLMSGPGTGRTMKFNTSNSAPWPGDASKEVPLDPSSVTVCSGVGPSGTCDIWLWADFEGALAGQSLASVRVETI